MANESCPSCGRADFGEGRACQWCNQVLSAPEGVRLASIGQRFGAFILDAVLLPVTLFIGWLIWWLIALGNGQTPGKQILGIRVYTATGEPASWGRTFFRELIAKLITGILVGWIVFIDRLWALWDKDKQALYDKMAGTIVVDDKASGSQMAAS